jgi:hypothetical protein
LCDQCKERLKTSRSFSAFAVLSSLGRGLHRPASSTAIDATPLGHDACAALVAAASPSSTATNKTGSALSARALYEEMRMKKTLAVLATVAALATTTVIAPAPAEARGIGPGLAFGLAAGALAAGAAAAYGPYYHGPGYGYYGYAGPRYYGPSYYGGPYAYYGGPYYRHRYWRRW